MSRLPQCQDCGKTGVDLDEFASCPACRENRQVKFLAEEIAGEAVLQFVGHTCGHRHPNRESAQKCTEEREAKYEAFVTFTAGIIRKIKQ